MTTKELLSKYTAQDFNQMLHINTMTQLAENWNCSIDTVRSAIRTLGLGKMRVDKTELTNRFSKQEWEELYTKHGYLIYKVAEELKCHKDTVSKILEDLGIQKVHSTAQYTPEVRAKLSTKAKLRPNRNLEAWTRENPNWHKQGVVTRQGQGTYKRPHTKNRKVLQEISHKVLERLIQRFGVQHSAQVVGCSPSTLYDFCHNHHLSIFAGFKNELFVGWNKGLTKETDPRVARGAQHLSETKKAKIASGEMLNPVGRIWEAIGSEAGHPSSLERTVGQELTSRGICFTTQHPVNRWHVDFFVGSANLIVEVHGCMWHKCTKCDVLIHASLVDSVQRSVSGDKALRTYCKNRKIGLVEIWEHDINTDLQGCISKIEQAIQEGKNV